MNLEEKLNWAETFFFKFANCEILGRDVRPCERDRRICLDLVVRERGPNGIPNGAVVFVIVKLHHKMTKNTIKRRLSIQEKNMFRRGILNWCKREKYEGEVRADVLHLYFEDGEDHLPEVDHVMGVIPSDQLKIR